MIKPLKQTLATNMDHVSRRFLETGLPNVVTFFFMKDYFTYIRREFLIGSTP